MSTGDGVATRVLAARAVQAVLFDGRSLKAVLNESLPSLGDSRDRALVEAMVMASIRYRTSLDATLRRYMPRPPGKRDADLRSLLYIGMAQIRVLELPAHAALATTVDAARAMGRSHQAGMVNAILRRVQREGLVEGSPADAWPEFLRTRVRSSYSDDVFAASASMAPMFLRVNPRQISRDAYLEALIEVGLDAVVVEAHASALLLPVAVPVHELPGFAQGWVSVQDLSAQLVVPLMELTDGLRILDACAAPGGKTAAILEQCAPSALVALDSNARRVKQIHETLQRTDTMSDAVTLQQADAREYVAEDAFDRILLDVPCSATGVVRRQPDVLLHRRESDLESLTQVQAALLDQAWQQLKPGGLLLYTTCSILPEENAQQVEAFVRRHADARCVEIDSPHYGVAQWLDGQYRGHQRLPGDLQADGFFYSRLLKGTDA